MIAVRALILMLALAMPARVLAGDAIIFYGDRNIAPYEFLDRDGQPAGASVDLARAVGRAIGRPVEIRLTDVENARARIAAGDGDAILTLAPTKGRHAAFDFTEPTLPAPFALYALSAGRETLLARDLASLRIGMTNGGYPQAFFRDYRPDLVPVLTRNTDDGIDRLLRGEVDAIGGPAWAVRRALDRRGVAGIERLWTFSDSYVSFGVRDGNAELVADLNRGLLAIKASGEFNEIVARWAPPRPLQLDSRQVYGLSAAAILALVLLLGMGATLLSLRRQKRRLAAEIAHRHEVEAELKEAGAAAFKSADLLGFVLGGASAAVFDFDLRTRQAYWSPENFALFGIDPRTSPAPEKWEEVVHPEDRTLWWSALERAIAAGQTEFRQEYRIIHADKGVRWMDSRSRVSYASGGEALRVGGINIDITELAEASRQLEEKVRESADLRADLQAVMDAVPAAIWIARDPEARVINGNRASYSLLRMCPGLNASKSASDTSHLHFRIFDGQGREVPPDHLPVQRAARGEEVMGSELSLCFEDGVVVHEYGNAVPLRAEDGTIKGAVAAFIDISRLKETEAQLKAAKAEADRANDAKSRFLAATGHDLRQPLQALGLYIGALEGRLAGADRELMAPIRACLGTLGGLLDDLLDLGRLDAGILVPRPEGFPIAALLERIAATHAPVAGAKALRFKAVASRLMVRTDPLLLERIVGNLVANAIRYTDSGGILVGCRRRQGRAWLEVRDSGIGIPADKTGEIFEEFVQLGNAERSREKGTGLGLAIVQRTARLLGLEVQVTSRPGWGSVFSVELPAIAAGTAPAASGPRPLRIALIEDDPVVRDALDCALGGLGHGVVAAASSAEVLGALAGAAPDLVISDYRLAGGETGIEAVAALRAAFGPRLAAVILTGDTNPALGRAIAVHGIEVQHKPLEFDALRTCIDRHTASVRPVGGGDA